ncbi:hypothetical protein MATL_G00096410 [Megalops atlanticus]|uniref:Uncharacterized protein n=1 Tax=Megalops atlanticus TaxID=7932 RepID=A0A9D3Q4B5_MEGAT|nr:hypothetical protein MATL_G00096410 [Megalops atlanticus]
MSQVHRGEPASTGQGIQGLLNAGKWKGVLAGLRIQLPIVYTHAVVIGRGDASVPLTDRGLIKQRDLMGDEDQPEPGGRTLWQ